MSERLTAPQLRILARAEDVVWDPPYGVWRLDGARLNRRMCETIERAGLIERGINLGSSVYLCRLTDKGRTALARAGDGGGPIT